MPRPFVALSLVGGLALGLAACTSRTAYDAETSKDGEGAAVAELEAVSTGATDSGGPITSAELRQKGYPYPTDLVSGANQTQFANYAWRLFIASMQPTATLPNGSGRGAPNPNTSFISSGSPSPQGKPLVFESLYHRTEAFPVYSATQPETPIGHVPTYYTKYEDPATEEVHPLTIEGPNLPYVYLDETNQIGQNFLYYQNSNDPAFPVLFMAKVNEAEARYARMKSAAGEGPSTEKAWVFPNNVLEVKTAWRRVRDIKNSDPSRYHQAKAIYYSSSGSGAPTQHTDTFALIAIHIIQKTANYQQFIFTTFEHVDAVTRTNGVITDPAFELTYDTLHYDSGHTQSYNATPVGAYAVNEVGQPGASNGQTTYALPNAGSASMAPTTVVQPKTITKEVNDVNNQVYGLITALDSTSVWANYRLKGVQAVPTSDQTALDYYLANIVVESSQPGIQLFRGGANGGLPIDKVFTNDRNPSNPGDPTDVRKSANVSLNVKEGKEVPFPTYTMGGCQGCHGRAQQKGRDFSFLAQASVGVGKELDSVPAAALSPAARTAHNARMSASANWDE